MSDDDRRSFLVRAGAYAGEQGGRLALAAVAGIFVARHLGPEGLGLLSFAGSIFGLLVPVVSLGLPGVLVREFSTRAQWHGVLASALVRQLAAAAVAAASGFLIVSASRGWQTDAVLTAAVLAPLPFLSLDRSLQAFLEATGRVRAIVMAGVTGGLIGAALKLAGVAAGVEVWLIATATTIEALVVAAWLASAVPGRRSWARVRFHADREIGRELTREGLPFLLSAIAVTLYMRIDTTMLGLLVGDLETGIYAAAVRLSEVWYFLPMAGVAAVRPRLANLVRDVPAYEAMVQRLMTGSVAVSYLVVLSVLLLGDTLVAFLYGPAYVDTVPVLMIHVLAAPFVFLGVAAGPWFVDRRMGRAALVRSATGAVANIALNLALLPVLGARGAAIATLVSYAIAGVLLNGVRRDTRRLFRLQMRALLLRWP